MMKLLPNDLRHAARTLLKRPGFTALAVLSLALGIGANTAIFSVVNGILIEALPYQQPDRLVRVTEYRRSDGEGRGTLSLPNARDLGARSRLLTGIAGYDEWRPTLAGDQPLRLDGASVTANYFDLLGIAPAAGRFFRAEEDEPGSSQRVVLSHRLWQQRFGGRDDVVGQVLELNGIPYTVAGVAAADFEDPQLSGAAFGTPQLWRVSPSYFASPGRDGRSFTAVARLAPDATLETAQAEADAIMAALAEQYPEENAGIAFRLVPLKDHITGAARQPLLVFLGAVGFVLLIACANVATLLLARNADRSRELAVRGALGATRSRLVRQLLAESLVLAVLGGGIGVLLATWATAAISAFNIEQLPRLERVAVDPSVLAFAMAVTLATVLLFGLLPALQAGTGRPAAALGTGGRGSIGPGHGRGAFRTLVGVEVALALVLLVGAGLLIRSFWLLQQVDPGIRTAGVLTMELDPPYGRYSEDPGAMTRLHAALAERIGAIQGVAGVGAADILPFSGNFNGLGFSRADRPEPARGQGMSAEARAVTGGYFDTLGMPLIRGRGIRDDDRADTPRVVVINRAMADRYWPGEDALGKPIRMQNTTWEVVGIVGDVHQFSLRQSPEPAMYLAQPQAPAFMRDDIKLVVRTAVEPAAIVSQVRSAIQAVDPSIPVSNVTTMDRAVAATLTGTAFQTSLLGIFAAVALLLGATGIYSVIACGVARRTRELGVRQALGASPRALTWQVVREGLAPVLLGLLAGTIVALVAGRAIAGLLFGIAPADPATLATVAGALLAVALLASYLPARRAARIQPTEALRAQ